MSNCLRCIWSAICYNVSSLTSAFCIHPQVELENWVNSIHSACAAAFARHRGKTGTLHLLQEEIFRLEKAIESVSKYKYVAIRCGIYHLYTHIHIHKGRKTNIHFPTYTFNVGLRACKSIRCGFSVHRAPPGECQDEIQGAQAWIAVAFRISHFAFCVLHFDDADSAAALLAQEIVAARELSQFCQVAAMQNEWAHTAIRIQRHTVMSKRITLRFVAVRPTKPHWMAYATNNPSIGIAYERIIKHGICANSKWDLNYYESHCTECNTPLNGRWKAN